MSRFRVVHVVNNEVPLPHWAHERLTNAGIALVVFPSSDNGDLESLLGDADLLWDYCGMGAITRHHLETLRRCGAIVKVGSGTDHIDVAAATELGVIVVNTPYVLTSSVADHTISLLFGLVRHVARQDRLIRSGRWSPLLALPLKSFQDATLGLVGFGRIPQAIVLKLSGFQMQFMAFDPYVPADIMNSLGVEQVSLDTLLRHADYVSLHCPLTAETRHLIGEHELRMMKSHAVVVNTARGAIVDEVALIEALKKGWIQGAALDVLEKEPPDSCNPLLELDNVILSPHIGGYSDRFPDDYAEACIEAILDLSQGLWPRSVVNPAVKPRWGDLSAPR